MATRNETHVHDLSTFANFKDWASSIGAALAAFGWLQSNDSGQVVWTATVLTLTQVTVGANAVYSYSSFTGPAPRVGMSVTFSGFTNGGNNVTATLTAVSGGASGTVTVALTTQVNETHAGSGSTTAQSTVPASGASVYEIWQPGDGLTAYFVRFDYTNASGTQPQIQFKIGTSTNGSGTLTGFTSTQMAFIRTSNSGASLFNCLYSGDSGNFRCMMWRDANAGFNGTLCIERSRDSSGNFTSSYVTIVSTRQDGGGINGSAMQQSVVFGVGAAVNTGFNNTQNWSNNCVGYSGGASLFNGNVPLSPIYPIVGFLDNPLLGMAVGGQSDFSEAASLTTNSVYGSSHTYAFSKNQNMNIVNSTGVCMLFE
jgi:hypothetical protein